MKKLKVLLLSPAIDGTDVGEAYVTYKWATALSEIVDLTVLTMQRENRPSVAEQLAGAEVITWPEPSWLLHFERFNAMLKPSWPLYMLHVRRWMRTAMHEGRHFDVAHQLSPIAARYPTPLLGYSLPYVIGPLGGSLSTPEAFRKEVGSGKWFTRLRAVDQFRFARDPWLRASYEKAAIVLGVAPYVREALGAVPIKRFELLLELGVDDLPLLPKRFNHNGLRLLHVGRAVRTKGLRDVVRAMAALKDLTGLTLTSAGGGEEVEACRTEAERLGVADRITFLGQIARERVSKLYETSDVFVFPSFREPTGGVLYEAMRAGLPVITVRRGGPEFIVDDSSGIRLAVTTPEALSSDIAKAIRKLYHDPALRRRLGEGAHSRIGIQELWPSKAARLLGLYRDVLGVSEGE